MTGIQNVDYVFSVDKEGKEGWKIFLWLSLLTCVAERALNTARGTHLKDEVCCKVQGNCHGFYFASV